jgi:hypothetical protein
VSWPLYPTLPYPTLTWGECIVARLTRHLGISWRPKKDGNSEFGIRGEYMCYHSSKRLVGSTADSFMAKLQAFGESDEEFTRGMQSMLKEDTSLQTIIGCNTRRVEQIVVRSSPLTLCPEKVSTPTLIICLLGGMGTADQVPHERARDLGAAGEGHAAGLQPQTCGG